MPGAGFTSENPWESAPQSLWRHQSLDPSLHAARARVAQGFAKEHVLETAIIEGRDGKQGDAHW